MRMSDLNYGGRSGSIPLMNGFTDGVLRIVISQWHPLTQLLSPREGPQNGRWMSSTR